MTGIDHILMIFTIFILGFLIGRIAAVAIEALPEGRFFFFKNLRNKKFSLSNFIVQLIVGIVFVLIHSKYGISAEFMFFAYIMLILITMFFIDLKTKTIPDELVASGFLGGFIAFIYNIFIPLKIYPSSGWWEPLIGMLPGSGILLTIAVLGMIFYKSDDVMGMGDVKIFAPIGMLLGWKMCMLALLISMFIGGVTSLILVLLRVKKRKDTIPFGPFMSLAVLIVILFGEEIWKWYFYWM